MAINVNYGDISSALGLALQGGQAVRQRQQQQQDMQFQQMVADEQAKLDANHAHEVSQALGVQEQNANLEMAQRRADQGAQQDAATNQLHQQQLQAQQEESNARLQQSQAQADLAHRYQDADQQMQVQAFQDKQKASAEKDAAIATLTPEQQAVVKATGRMPYVPNSGDADSAAFKLLDQESRRLQGILDHYEAQKLNPNNFAAQLRGAPEPAEIAAARQQKAQIDAELQKRTSGIMQSGTLGNARIAQAAAQQRQQTGGNVQDAGQTPVINTAAEYAALPSGAKYIDAQDGKVYVKK